MEQLLPVCKLVGENGNVFNIIGCVKKALVQAGYRDKASEFTRLAFEQTSYDKVLQLAMQYVEIN